MNRRDFLKIAGAAPVVLLSQPVFALPGGARVVVLIELSGGNDSLNTFVPYADPRYRRLRPNIAVAASEVVRLDDTLGLHPALKPLVPAWGAGELAIVEGLGYRQPNRSHFRSIEIWDGGTAADEYDAEGWVARAMGGAPAAGTAVLVGGGDDGPVAGAGALAVEDPYQAFRAARGLSALSVPGGNDALAHVVRTRNELLGGLSKLERGFETTKTLSGRFGKDAVAKGLEVVMRIALSGVAAVVKVKIGGFDTHVNQPRRQEALLGRLGAALAEVRRVAREAGRWDDMLVLTYSEFGRRPAENGAAGTDHGTAAAHLALGGAVRGGRFGKAPSLEALDDNGDLVFTTDFRRVYSTVARKWWSRTTHAFDEFEPLGFI